MQATAGKQPGRQTKAGKQIANHQFAQTCRQDGGQAGKQASKQAGEHAGRQASRHAGMCFCVFLFFVETAQEFIVMGSLDQRARWS